VTRRVLADEIDQVYLTSLEGLGSSYRMKGYFTLRNGKPDEFKIEFEGVAFGGNYGGHNVNVTLTDQDRELLIKSFNSNIQEIEDLLSEIQRRLLNNEMIVEYDSIKPETPENVDGLGGI
jgi:hypothetical protein